MSQVCPDGRDEDWRPDGPMLVLTGGWLDTSDDDERAPASQTPFVLYRDGTVIAGGLVARGPNFSGQEHATYHLSSNAVNELMLSLNWKALLDLDRVYRPIQKERRLWQQNCYGTRCAPYVELQLWSEGCRKIISVDGLELMYLQQRARGGRLRASQPDAARVAMALLALDRLPRDLKQALLQLARFRYSGGKRWCKGAECTVLQLPGHEVWGYPGR